MRLWSLHPRYLDRVGLVACWREALLAQAVLAGRTRGYRQHPQLARFRAADDPVSAIGRYLSGVEAEARSRGYRFDPARILQPGTPAAALSITRGQLALERDHLRRKLQVRDQGHLRGWPTEEVPAPHPLFLVVAGPVAEWERAGRP
jgi:hypothetical protein